MATYAYYRKLVQKKRFWNEKFLRASQGLLLFLECFYFPVVSDPDRYQKACSCERNCGYENVEFVPDGPWFKT